MGDKIYRYLAEDHRRLEDALNRATAYPGKIEYGPYAEFRNGLLRHIRREERILLPAAAVRFGKPLPDAARLRLDHGALAALLIPHPTDSIVAAIRNVLTAHNPVEEGPNGVYDQCEMWIGADADEVLEKLKSTPDVRVNPHVDTPAVMEFVRSALHRAGHSWPV